MLAMILAMLAVGSRPAELVKPGEEAAYATWLEARVRAAISKSAGKDCSSAPLKVLPGLDATPTDPVRAALPNAYVYYEAVDIAGCGLAERQRLLVRREGAEWKSTALAPGQTVATFILQRDLVKSLVSAVVTQMAMKGGDCGRDAFSTSFRIADTRLIGPFVPGQAWKERWVVHACDADYPIDVSLSPTPDGGTDFSTRVDVRP
jgi:hypothetical protein